MKVGEDEGQQGQGGGRECRERGFRTGAAREVWKDKGENHDATKMNFPSSFHFALLWLIAVDNSRSEHFVECVL